MTPDEALKIDKFTISLYAVTSDIYISPTSMKYHPVTNFNYLLSTIHTSTYYFCSKLRERRGGSCCYLVETQFPVNTFNF